VSVRLVALLVLLVPVNAVALTCRDCHANEVEQYSRFSMAHSLRRAAREPASSFQGPGTTKFTIVSDARGTRQRMERAGEVSEYQVAYVIGSGNHASGYLVQLGDHLFQSPIAFYTQRVRYDMAPGYEKLADADFTRPITEDCVLCHSGKPMLISGTVSRYQTPAFEQETISCQRCHGPTEKHLERPVPGSIVNPAKLTGAARDSICEQCHLSGVVRVLNPGKNLEDFRPGEPLEKTFTVYRDALPPNRLKVISHSEQLAASACLRNSNGKLWCGTCHDPHNKPVNTATYYRDRCLSCHANQLPRSHPAPVHSDCVACHMPRRSAFDGGHTAFTDHRIARRPEPQLKEAALTDLVAWREPDSGLATRNLALAYINAGLQRNAVAWVVRGYRMLTDVQASYPDDPVVLNGFGAALMAGNQPGEARFAYHHLIALDPQNPVNEENAGRADLAAGDLAEATQHLERALQLDPLLLSAAGLLENLYQNQGKHTEMAEIAERVRRAMSTTRLRSTK
jgi:tetratricopeptide (TPR) repeat protein